MTDRNDITNTHPKSNVALRDYSTSKYAFLLNKKRILRNFLVSAELEIQLREKSDVLAEAGLPNDLPERLRKTCEAWLDEADDTVKSVVEARLAQAARELIKDIRTIIPRS